MECKTLYAYGSEIDSCVHSTPSGAQASKIPCAENQLFFLSDSKSVGIDDADNPTCANNKHSNIQY